MTPHVLFRLRGNIVESIGCSGNGIVFSPSEGMLRRCGKLFLVVASEIPAGSSIGVQLVSVSGSDQLQPVVTEITGQPERELVLVQEYSNGCGAKRWPSFSVTFGQEVRILRQDQTGGGSGSEAWTLVSAPIGWAENIAGQFINERDFCGQTLSYNPGFKPIVRHTDEIIEDADSHEQKPTSGFLSEGAWGALDGLKL